MEYGRLRQFDTGLLFLLGWYKEIDLQDSYTALPRGLVMWDIFDHEAEPVYDRETI